MSYPAVGQVVECSFQRLLHCFHRFLVIFPRHDYGIRVRVIFLYIVLSPHYEGPSFGFRFLHIADFELIVRALVTELFSALIIEIHWFLLIDSCAIL